MDGKIFTLGMLTSGGDSPGMNPCIRAVVRAASINNAQALGVMDGFEGLINSEFRPLGVRDVGGILQRGGTILQTRRSTRFLEPHFQREAIRNMNSVGMDGLIVAGGNGSLNGAHLLLSCVLIAHLAQVTDAGTSRDAGTENCYILTES